MQLFKSVSFPANDLFETNRVVTLAFGQKERDIYEQISPLTSFEIRKILGVSDYALLQQNAAIEQRNVSQYIKYRLSKKITSQATHSKSDVTFKASKDLPFQRWYPYIEGYSPRFVESIISRSQDDNNLIYEPFAGTGTTIFAADNMGINCCYSEINPLLRFLIDVKLSILTLTDNKRKKLASKVKESYLEIIGGNQVIDEELLTTYRKVFKESEYFPKDTFKKILMLKNAIRKINEEIVANILTVAVVSSLVAVSYLKKQGDLRFKTEKEKQNEMRDLEHILPKKIDEIIEDI